MNHRQVFFNVMMGKGFLSMTLKIEAKKKKAERYNYSIFCNNLYGKRI